MRKILLFGLVIIVATSVFAFGGGGKSRKASIYRGTGVDSINVHINGKDSDSEKETCAAEKQCGDYCCQGDNVCKHDSSTGELQCCDPSLEYCCPSGTSVYVPPWGKQCCDGTLACGHADEEGNCLNASWMFCCPPGSTLYGPFENVFPATTDFISICCAAGQKPYCMEKFYYGCNYRCCDGTISPGTGVDGADECLE